MCELGVSIYRLNLSAQMEGRFKSNNCDLSIRDCKWSTEGTAWVNECNIEKQMIAGENDRELITESRRVHLKEIRHMLVVYYIILTTKNNNGMYGRDAPY